VPFWLCVGDIASDTGAYEPLGAPVYWIHGNNDDFDALASGDLPDGLHHIPNGTAIEIDAGSEDPAYNRADPPDNRDDPADNPDVGRTFRSGTLRVAGLGGTFAPTWYATRAADLPHPKKGTAKATELADKRRHFVRDEVEAAKQLRGVGVFMTHEAAKPFRPTPGRGPDAGKAQINDVLRAMQPKVHLFGHHHRFSEQTIEGVRSYGLDLVTRSYVLIHLPGFAVELHAD